MQTIYASLQMSPFKEPLCACIGFFDGVHLGHRYLLDQLKKEAGQRGQKSGVITFRNHPASVIKPGSRIEMISTFEEKLELLRGTGIDYCIVFEFDQALRSIDARGFITEVLSQRLSVKTLIIGYDHRFGSPSNDTYEDYCTYGRETAMEVIKEESYSPDQINISSSAIRRLIKEGEVELAAGLLGHPLSIRGRVVHGSQIGRTIGFPTANIQIDDSTKITPRDGVYAVVVEIKGKRHGGMLNIGKRPTVNNGEDKTLEVNIFGFNHEIYGEEIRLEFLEFIRKERKMGSRVELMEQLEKDKEKIKALLQEKYGIR